MYSSSPELLIKKKDQIDIFVEQCLYDNKGLYSCLARQLTEFISYRLKI